MDDVAQLGWSRQGGFCGSCDNKRVDARSDPTGQQRAHPLRHFIRLDEFIPGQFTVRQRDRRDPARRRGRRRHTPRSVLRDVPAARVPSRLPIPARVTLARTFFRDALLMILDWPTAPLDAKAEHELFARIGSC